MNAGWLWDVKISESQAKKILKDSDNRRFRRIAALMLARNNEPKKVFKRYLDPLVFCREWASIKKMMRKDRWDEPRIIFWQAVYEKVKEKYTEKGIKFRKRAVSVKSDLCKAVGRDIRATRKKEGITQRGLANRLGISQQMISRIEKGSENASLTTLNNIAQALKMKIKIDFV